MNRPVTAATAGLLAIIGATIGVLLGTRGHIATVPVPWKYASASVKQGKLMALAGKYGPGSNIYYRWGGASPSGFDCSGYVWYLYRRVGISIPRTSYGQWHSGERVSVGSLRPGDVLLFQGGGSGPRPGHAGLFVAWRHGVAHFLEYYRTGYRARTSHLRGRYGYWGARRYFPHPRVPKKTYGVHIALAKTFKLKINGHWQWGVIYRGKQSRRVALIRYARAHRYGVLVRRGYVRVWVTLPLPKPLKR